jgi:transposase-like protein
MKKTKLMLEIEERFGENLEDLLRRKYPEENTVEIGEELGVNNSTVGRWLKMYGIKIRNNSEAHLPVGFVKPTKEEIGKGNLNECESVNEIAEKFGVSCPLMRKWVKEFGMEIIDKRLIYDNKENRRKAVDELLEITGKRPEELSTRDFEIKKKDGISYIGIIFWYMRNNNCKHAEARNILLRDIYGSRTEVVNKMGICDDREYRRKSIDELLEKTGKKPDKLSTKDFRIKKKDGLSCNGILKWYQRNNDCNRAAARDILIQELYNAERVTKKDWFEDVLKEYVNEKN